jgi:hypothetical protein
MKAIKTDLSGSLFYEVFLGLVSHGKEIGRTCIQLKASSPFLAAVKAEDTIDHRYGEDVISRTLRVSQISKEEYLYVMAA